VKKRQIARALQQGEPRGGEKRKPQGSRQEALKKTRRGGGPTLRQTKGPKGVQVGRNPKKTEGHQSEHQKRQLLQACGTRDGKGEESFLSENKKGKN